MGLFDEPGLQRLVDAGCPKCGSVKLSFRTYVDGLVPIMGGEPIGRIKWVYDGEKFVDGVFAVSCADCNEVVFAADECPRCHAPGGLQRALETPNQWPVPPSCVKCSFHDMRYIAFLPSH